MTDRWVKSRSRFVDFGHQQRELTLANGTIIIVQRTPEAGAPILVTRKREGGEWETIHVLNCEEDRAHDQDEALAAATPPAAATETEA